MSSVQQGLPRNRSFDSAISPLSSLHLRTPPSPHTPASHVGRERSALQAVVQSQVWPPQTQALPLASPGPVPAAPEAPRCPPLTIAVDAEALIQTEGPAPYRPHAALPAIKKFLRINEGATAGAPRVEMVLLCHLPGAKRRHLLEALREAGLPIERVLFTRESALHDFLRPFRAMLYLSCCPSRVRNAVAEGIAAGCLVAKDADVQPDAALPLHVLRVAFDFDGVLADDLSQKRFDCEGLEAFHAYEDSARDVPMGPGPAQPLAKAMGQLRDQLATLRESGSQVPVDIRIAVVTARGSVAIARLFRTLEAWDLEPDEVFCLAGHDKTPFISGLKTDLYIDDDARHAARAKNVTLAVHMPTRSSLRLT